MSDMPDEYGAPVKMECGCSWHETTSWLICDECSKLDCFAPPKNYKTALELFEGNDLNLKSSSGVRQYAFNSYAVRRITNALRKHDEYQSERAAMAAEVERLRGALEEIHGYVDCGRHGAIERIIKAALAGGKEE